MMDKVDIRWTVTVDVHHTDHGTVVSFILRARSGEERTGSWREAALLVWTCPHHPPLVGLTSGRAF
jgi:hypothetical protein